ncbi:Sucrase/ferredoxin-like-domain-containing protein [Lactifluus volemus]|nr:Sucrase/ferredoxin-like-domain-containing protein [Lactifluus volemus]
MTINPLKRFFAVLPTSTNDPEQTHSALEAAGVPVSFADCRNCPNPCSDGHEEYPQRIASTIDTTSEMLGSVKPYRRQVVISTGKSDWEHSVTDTRGSLASYLSTIAGGAPTTVTAASEPVTPSTPTPQTPTNSIAGIFKDSETHTVSILNGSHDTLSKDYDYETVLVFPDYKVVTEVPRSLDGARELWRNSVNPSISRPGSTSEMSMVKSWVIPYTCVILICSHRTRDARCAIAAPKLEHGTYTLLVNPLIQIVHTNRSSPLSAFSATLQNEGWDVHTQLDDPSGSPLESYPDGSEKETELNRRLQDLNDSVPKRALILKTSHIGGHKYAGNVIIYMPQGAGVWYGRVSTHEVEPIVHTTILGGQILPPLLRGGVNLARPDCKRLNDW